MKRPSANSTPSSSKKARVDPIAKKCQTISAAVMEADELPKSAREMLAGMATVSLNKLKEDRHKYQLEVVDMVATTLSGIEARMRKAIDEAGVLASNADAERATRSGNLATAMTKLDAKKAEIPTLTAALSEAKAAVKEASHNHASAVHAQASSDTEVQTATGKKDRLEAALKDNFLPLKDGSITEKGLAKKMVASLVNVAKEHHVDTSLMHAIGVTLTKEVGARGVFDNTSLEHFEEDFRRRASEIAATIEQLASASASLAGKSQEASQALQAAKERQAAQASALKQAQDEQSACESDVKAAEKAVKTLEPDIAAAADAADAAKLQLENFQEGALANFMELKERCAPPPAPPTPPEEQQGPEVTVYVGGDEQGEL